MILSNLVNSISKSATMTMSEKARDMERAGLKIINFGTGETNASIASNIRESAINAIRDGKNKYTAISGSNDLKDAIIKKIQKERGLSYSRDEVIASSGAKQVLYNAIMSLINKGDEVILPVPYWVSYYEMVNMAQGVNVPMYSDSSKNFQIEADIVSRHITRKTRAIIINSPNNPTGSIYRIEEVKKISDLLLQHKDIYIILDEIYDSVLSVDKEFVSLLCVEPRLRDRILLVNGVSKSYAMTGWRLGYGVGNKDWISAMTKIQSHVTSCPSIISQIAATEALTGTQTHILQMRKDLDRKRSIFEEKLKAIECIKFSRPHGAFYFFIDCCELIGKRDKKGKSLMDGDDIANFLLEEAKIVVISGSSFGLPGFIRMSFSIPDDDIIDGLANFKKACYSLTY